MQRSDEQILTTHTGSLPRPPELTHLFASRVRGMEVDEAQIVAAGKEAVRSAVAKQIECGIDVINNGEQQRESFVLYVRRRLSGFGGEGQRPTAADVDQYPLFKKMQQEQSATKFSVTNVAHIPKAIGDIRYIDPRAAETECDDFAAALKMNEGHFVEAFMTAPSPGIVATIATNEHYDSMESYLTALATALRVEYEAINRHGFILQLDCPDLAMERHMAFRDRSLSEFLRFVEMVVESINSAIEKLPRDRVRMHLCWGNYEGPHDQDLPLQELMPIVRRLKVGAFVLPFANPRHAHEYRLLKDAALDDDQIVVAGVIDTLTNVVEHPEVIAERLERVAVALGDPRRVLAGTDCGFDTSAGNSRVAPDVAWAKLAALKEGARIASKRLF